MSYVCFYVILRVGVDGLTYFIANYEADFETLPGLTEI